MLGIIDEKHGDNAAALTNYEQGLEYAGRVGDQAARLRLLTALSNYYLNLSETDKTIDICHQGIRDALSLGEHEAASQFYNNLSIAHSYIREYEKAMAYSDKSIELKKHSSNEESLANAYLSKGLILTEMGDYDEGFRYYSLAEELYLKHNTYHALTQTHINYAWDYTSLKQFRKARIHLGHALHYAEKSGDKVRQAGAWNVAGYYYRHAGYADSVIVALEKGLSLALQAGNKRNALVAYEELSNHHRNTGNTSAALKYLMEAYHLKDTVFDAAKIQLAQSLNARYEAQHKEEEIKLLSAQQDNDRLTIQTQRITLMAVLLLVIGTSILLYVLFVRYKGRQEQKRKSELARRKESERLRIARDMHDEIGAGLTRIVMRSRQVKGHLHTGYDPKNGISEILEKMESESRQLSHNIGEIIWALNPQNDSLDTLCAYLRTYAYEYLEEAGIQTRLDFPDDVPSLPVAPEVRRNIFLILKESLNNLLKHSNATQAEVSLTISDRELSITVRDNGNGRNEDTPASGNGLTNMRKRAEEIGGTFSFSTEKGKGVSISITNVCVENQTKV